MSMTSHIAELKKKHQHLSEAVENAQRLPSYDALHLSKMKKEKLILKQEIERLSIH